MSSILAGGASTYGKASVLPRLFFFCTTMTPRSAGSHRKQLLYRKLFDESYNVFQNAQGIRRCRLLVEIHVGIRNRLFGQRTLTEQSSVQADNVENIHHAVFIRIAVYYLASRLFGAPFSKIR